MILLLEILCDYKAVALDIQHDCTLDALLAI